MDNQTLYTIFSTLVIVAGALFTIAVLTGIVRMIMKWRSPEVQDLEAPVRQYLLSEEEKTEYQQPYS